MARGKTETQILGYPVKGKKIIARKGKCLDYLLDNGYFGVEQIPAKRRREILSLALEKYTVVEVLSTLVMRVYEIYHWNSAAGKIFISDIVWISKTHNLPEK